MILELKKEAPELFTPESEELFRGMIKEGALQEIEWGKYVIGNEIEGLTEQMVSDYIMYLANLRSANLGLGVIFPGYEEEPMSMGWVSQYSNSNLIKTDFFEAKPSAYAKSASIEDDL